MRLVGIALFAAWLVAWAAAPHGEVARPTSIVGAVAVAGGDDAALAWLELRHGARDGTLHVVTVDKVDRVANQLHLPAGGDATAFRLADAGGGRFVLATEHRRGRLRMIELRRFGPGLDEALPPLATSWPHGLPPTTDDRVGEWQMAAAGDELVVSESLAEGTRLSVLGSDGLWASQDVRDARRLIGAGGGHTVVYEEESERAGRLVVAPSRDASWSVRLDRPACFADGGRSTTTAVVGLRGGYARLSRRGGDGCVEGLREGKPFQLAHVPLDNIPSARLATSADGHLAVYEEQSAQLTLQRVLLPDRPGESFTVDAQTASPLTDASVRYRLFGAAGTYGVTMLATRVAQGETQVVLERSGHLGMRVLAPVRRYQPDHRPLLRGLASLPLLVLLLGALAAVARIVRLRRLAPLDAGAPLAEGQAAIQGELANGADAPAGGLAVQRGRSRLMVFVEGAEVLRASDVRPRSQPRGDAVDVSAGAAVMATGIVEPGQLYRGEATLRARAGDLVLVGCTLAEARAHLARRAACALVVLGGAATIVSLLALGR